jgi:hypothetical protein
VVAARPFHSSSVAVLSLFRHEAPPLRCGPLRKCRGRRILEQCRVAHKLMHECNGVAKFVGLRR